MKGKLTITVKQNEQGEQMLMVEKCIDGIDLKGIALIVNTIFNAYGINRKQRKLVAQLIKEDHITGEVFRDKEAADKAKVWEDTVDEG